MFPLREGEVARLAYAPVTAGQKSRPLVMIGDGMRSLWRRLSAPAGGAPAVDQGGRIDLHYAAADGDLKRM
jgi:hypothetical protein